MLPLTSSLGIGNNSLITLIKPCNHKESSLSPKKCTSLTRQCGNTEETEVCVSVEHVQQKEACVHVHHLKHKRIIYSINCPQMPTELKYVYRINYSPTEAWVEKHISSAKQSKK